MNDMYTEDQIVLGGGPKTGKSTLADGIGGNVRHTDDLIGTFGWSEASEVVAGWMAEDGPWVIEGVATVRALRKALDESPDRPCDLLIWLSTPHEQLNNGQASMAKGCDTVLRGIESRLVERGVRIERHPRESPVA